MPCVPWRSVPSVPLLCGTPIRPQRGPRQLMFHWHRREPATRWSARAWAEGTPTPTVCRVVPSRGDRCESGRCQARLGNTRRPGASFLDRVPTKTLRQESKCVKKKQKTGAFNWEMLISLSPIGGVGVGGASSES